MQTGNNVKFVTLEDLTTGEIEVWGVEFEVDPFADGLKVDVLTSDDTIIRYNNSVYAADYGRVVDWPTLKYYDDIWHPADYLE